MGYSRSLSWSHTRQQVHNFCRRSFYLEYFPWGEPSIDQIRFLDRIQTPELLAGCVVHDAISMALRQYRRIHVIPATLADRALDWYWQGVRESEHAAKRLRSGKRPHDRGCVLDHHVYDEPEDGRIEKGSETISRCLENFFASEVWKRISKTKRVQFRERQGWIPVHSSLNEPRYVTAKTRIGLGQVEGLQIYTAFDFACYIERQLHIFDWKTGQRNPKTEAATKTQLATYALWGLNEGLEVADIRGHAVWLDQEPPLWNPLELTPQDIDERRAAIIRQARFERSLVTIKPGPKRGPDQGDYYVVKRSDFPKARSLRVCARCKFRAVCHKGSQEP